MRLKSLAITILLIFSSLGVGWSIVEREINWPDLVMKVEFEDPFESLTETQLRDLSIYARISNLLKNRPELVSDAMKEEAIVAEQKLRNQDVDIEDLLVKRLEIKALREERASAVVKNLNNQHVKIAGFLLPLEYSNKKVVEFLLVPWVGACIHTPPPPPNQIVFVTTTDGYESSGLFDPVWVSGTMKVQSAQKDLYLVDGSSEIQSGYTILASTVRRYKK